MPDSLPLIHIDQLQVGVFVSLDLPWLDHPFLVNSFLIRNEKQLKTLRELGLRSVAYDPARSEVPPRLLEREPEVPEPKPLQAEEQGLVDEKRQRAGRMQAHRERIHHCEQEYAQYVGSTKDVMADVLRDPAHATERAGAMVGSLAGTFLGEQGATVLLVASQKFDDVRYQHALNVMVLSMLLGKGLGLKREVVEVIGMGALLHDIGMVRIPPAVQRNTQRGRHEEALYRLHCEYGVQLVGSHVSPHVLAAIRDHHEFMDGSGFPGARKGQEIDPAARIVAIANRYDNLCNAPELVDALTPAEALSQMFAREAAHFDGRMLAAFVKELGVYPPGSFVRLSNGAIAIVISVKPGLTLKPSVLVYEPGVPRREALILDLSETADVTIECVLKPAALSQRVIEYLNPRMKLAYFAHKTGG